MDDARHEGQGNRLLRAGEVTVRRVLLAALLAAAPVVAHAGPADSVSACVDPAARRETGAWLRLIPAGETCRPNERPMSIVVMRERLFAIDADGARPASRPSRAPIPAVVLEADAALPLNRPLLIATTVLARNDGARLPQGSDAERRVVRVPFSCETTIDGRRGDLVRSHLAVFPSTGSPVGPPDARASGFVGRYPAARGRHRFAVSCAADVPVRVRGDVSLIILQY